MTRMTPLEFTLSTFLVSILAGTLGAMLGLGGGIIVVPALTLLFGVDIRLAIGASIVAVIATSSGSAATYVRDRIANMRVGMLLELATTSGAIFGAWLAGRIGGRWLYIFFAMMLLYAAAVMARGGKRRGDAGQPAAAPPPDAWADRLRLHGEYDDPAEGRAIAYRVGRTHLGLAVSGVAGVLSGLLGVGGGVMKVPVMNLGMGMPIKAATATSNFMIGVTAAASAGVYFLRGDVDPFIAGPVAVGVLAGARLGTRLFGRLRGQAIGRLFVLILLAVAIQMLIKGLRG
jgi:uncharacterized membrane protein YfcA